MRAANTLHRGLVFLFFWFTIVEPSTYTTPLQKCGISQVFSTAAMMLNTLYLKLYDANSTTLYTVNFCILWLSIVVLDHVQNATTKVWNFKGVFNDRNDV